MNTDSTRHRLPHTEIILDRKVEVDGALVSVEGFTIGEVEDSGWGGPTLFHGLRPGGRAIWQELVAGARDQHGEAMDEETLADQLITEGRFERIVRQAAGSRTRYALRYITALRISDGDDELEALQVREPRSIRFRGPVEITPEHFETLRKTLTLPEGTIHADIHLTRGWTRFYTAPEVG